VLRKKLNFQSLFPGLEVLRGFDSKIVKMRLTIRTKSKDETMALGEQLGKHLRPGDVIALFGDLGAGKTTLTKGIAAGMNLPADVHSPTFTLIHEHPGPVPLYHVDLYRLSTEEEVERIGIDEYIYGDGVTVIEWADRMRSLLPSDRLDIEIRFEAKPALESRVTETEGENVRTLTFETGSPRMQSVIEELTKYAASCD